ncbi:MAG: type II secretion system protein GspL [Gammaproteobacteria bacterium]|nr:type II secretion system protein GspL [Gammaproteobacteria bacterium]
MFLLQLQSDESATLFEYNEAGEVIALMEIQDLSKCPKISKDADFVLLMPGENIVMADIKLPKMRTSEKSSAIIYALEEQLLSDPDNVVIISSDSQVEGVSSVAVIEKNIFEKICDDLKMSDLQPQCVIPDFLAISWETKTWSIVLQGKMALVRTDVRNGFSVDVDNLFLLLKLKLDKNKDEKPEKINCWHKNNIIDITQFEKLMIPFSVFDASNNACFEIKKLFENPAINFFHRKYKKKLHSAVSRRYWIACGSVFAALVSFLFLSNVVQWVYYRSELKLSKANVATVYRTLFPNAKNISEPRFRIDSLLKKYEAASDANIFLHTYALVGQALLQFPDISTQEINFNKNQLQLTVNASSLQKLGAFLRSLRKEGLQTSAQVLKNNPNDVQAEIIVS